MIDDSSNAPTTPIVANLKCGADARISVLGWVIWLLRLGRAECSLAFLPPFVSSRSLYRRAYLSNKIRSKSIFLDHLSVSRRWKRRRRLCKFLVPPFQWIVE